MFDLLDQKYHQAIGTLLILWRIGWIKINPILTWPKAGKNQEKGQFSMIKIANFKFMIDLVEEVLVVKLVYLHLVMVGYKSPDTGIKQ